MNKALLLLLVTLVQSRSDGILLPNPDNSDKFEENLEDFQLEDWDSSEPISSYVISNDYSRYLQPFTKRSTGDVLTRRSALDKNFMRFGRDSGEKISQKFFRDLRSGLTGSKQNFVRFGRGLKDNFIRFGRGAQENFIRFGRGGKDSFIRFGRGRPDDFFRSGKSVRENFIRFGKADKNFMRFGRENPEREDKQTADLYNQDYLSHLQKTTGKYDETSGSFERFGKSQRSPDNFIRFGKSGNQKEGRNGTNFLRFGKSDPAEGSEISETDDSDFNPSNQDSNSDALKYSSFTRIKRQTTGAYNSSERSGSGELQHEETSEKFKSNSGNVFKKPAPTGDESRGKEGSEKAKVFKRRSTGFFEDATENFPRRIYPVLVDNHWQNLENLKNSRLTPPFFPTPLKISKNVLNPYFNFLSPGVVESKRDQGGSNFIRFG